VQLEVVVEGPWTPKLSYIYTYFIHFPKQHNFLIILIVISAINVLSTWRNLHLKSTIYKNAGQDAMLTGGW